MGLVIAKCHHHRHHHQHDDHYYHLGTAVESNPLSYDRPTTPLGATLIQLMYGLYYYVVLCVNTYSWSGCARGGGGDNNCRHV